MSIHPSDFAGNFIEPNLIRLENLGGPLHSDDAARMLLAIAYQESGLEHRHQIGGPAHGFWQFERLGGVAGVLQHPATSAMAKAVLESELIPVSVDAAFAAIEFNNMVAVSWARLLLYSDPLQLPTYRDQGIAWSYYQRNWRPGKPHPSRWADAWKLAQSVYGA